MFACALTGLIVVLAANHMHEKEAYEHFNTTARVMLAHIRDDYMRNEGFDAESLRTGLKLYTLNENVDCYVFDADGSAAVGWYTDKSGAKYYAGTDGIALTGWQEIDKKSYFFLQNGTMAVNTAIDGCTARDARIVEITGWNLIEYKRYRFAFEKRVFVQAGTCDTVCFATKRIYAKEACKKTQNDRKLYFKAHYGRKI